MSLGTILFMIGLSLSVLFVHIVHFVLRPLVNELYRKYEPLFWHWNFKLKRKVEKTLRKVREKLLKCWLKTRYFYK